MAVFSKISQKNLKNFLSTFNIGDLMHYEGIQAGTENTNYFVYTTEGSYVLTIFEKLKIDEAPFYLSLMRHLAKRRTPCPLPILNKNNEIIQLFNNKPATIVSKLEGKAVEHPNSFHCYEIGKALAIAHQDALDFTEIRGNTRSLLWWKKTCPNLLKFLDITKQKKLMLELKDQETFLKSEIYNSLPKAVIHADLFRDNALFLANNTYVDAEFKQPLESKKPSEKLGGIIDFYFAGYDSLLFDLAVVANDWTVDLSSDKTGSFKKKELAALFDGYQNVRKLSPTEIEAWPMVLRTAAFRFWVSRLYDWYLPRNAALLTPKDPMEYEIILSKRQSEMKESSC